jgi:hypothetical protein
MKMKLHRKARNAMTGIANETATRSGPASRKFVNFRVGGFVVIFPALVKFRKQGSDFAALL